MVQPQRRRPLHRQPGALATVMVGGMAGTLARWSLTRVLPVVHGWPLPTVVTNLAGAFCLGLLLEHLAASGPDEGARRRLRLLLGTGFLGAFTTMSSLAVEAVLLADAPHPGQALAYLLGSLAGGVVLAWAGILVGHRTATRAGAA